MSDTEVYPTDEELEIIEKWSYKDIDGFFEYVKSNWWGADWGWTEQLDEDGNTEYHISTGGWSGNEDIIEAMHKNSQIWLYSWVQSKRGGHYIFNNEYNKHKQILDAHKK